jgi:serine/threonine-protein kinase
MPALSPGAEACFYEGTEPERAPRPAASEYLVADLPAHDPSQSISLDEPGEAVPAPRMLGRYRILDEVASGGMATLFLAATDGAGGYEKTVALKRIHPHLAKDRRYLEMFLDEARLAARIVHPNVCGVIDFGESEGAHFLAMDFIAGVPLAELLRTVGRSATLRADPHWLPVVARILVDSAEGLHAAHELRDADGQHLEVVHRDVSPQNLLVGFDGVTRVLDFGIAAAADRIHHTRTGEVKGKFAYMAPEQVKQGAPDRRMDVWALGVVAWEALALRRLFRREGTAATLYAVLEEAIEPPSASAPRLPPTLDGAVMSALERARDKRTPTTRAFATQLRLGLERAGLSIADPATVAELLRRAFPEREDTLRSRIAAARARSQASSEESGVLTTERRTPDATRRWLTVAVVCLALLGIVAGAWGVGSLVSGRDETTRLPPLARAEEPAPRTAPHDTTAPTVAPTAASGPPAWEPPPAEEAALLEPAPRTQPRRRGAGRRTGGGAREPAGPDVDLAREW